MKKAAHKTTRSHRTTPRGSGGLGKPEESGVSLKPVDDNVVIRRDEREEYSKGGVAIAECAKETPTTGTVLAVGPGRLLPNGERVPVSVKPGEVVLFYKLAGQTITLKNDIQFSIMREDELLGVLED